MRTLLIILSTVALGHTAPNTLQSNAWVKAVKPSQPAGKFMEKPAHVENINPSQLEAKLKGSSPLTSAEIGYMANLRTKYQADPVKFRGKPEEAMLKIWKTNYKDSNLARPSKDPHVNTLWDKIVQGKRLTEQDLKFVVEIRTRIQKDPTGYKGSIEDSISKTVKSQR
jgi:hypothetical protein